MTFDVSRVRAAYPALSDGYAYLDGAAGTQVPTAVIEAIAETYRSGIGNAGGAFPASGRADARRGRVPPRHRRPDRRRTRRRDPRAEHDHAHLPARGHAVPAVGPGGRGGRVPARSRRQHQALGAGRRAAAAPRCAGPKSIYRQRSCLPPSTASCCPSGPGWSRSPRRATSSAPGRTCPPSPPPRTRSARCATWTACTPPRTCRWTCAALGADFYATSAYKWSGPHIGTVVADPALLETLHPDKLAPAPAGVPGRFERGTAGVRRPGRGGRGRRAPGRAGRLRRRQPAGTGAGLHGRRGAVRGAAVRPPARRPGRDAARDPVRQGGPARADGVLHRGRVHARARSRRALAARQVNVWNGDNYAWELAGAFGLRDSGGGVRAGLVHYNDEAEVDRLLAAVAELASGRRTLRASPPAGRGVCGIDGDDGARQPAGRAGRAAA